MTGADLIRDRLDRLPAPFTARDIQRRGWAGLDDKDSVAAALAELVDDGTLARTERTNSRGRTVSEFRSPTQSDNPRQLPTVSTEPTVLPTLSAPTVFTPTVSAELTVFPTPTLSAREDFDEIRLHLSAACSAGGIDAALVFSHMDDRDWREYQRLHADGELPFPLLRTCMIAARDAIEGARCSCGRCQARRATP